MTEHDEHIDETERRRGLAIESYRAEILGRF